MATNQYRFVHKEMLYKNLNWLKLEVASAAVSFRDTDKWVMRLYFTLNKNVPDSGKDAFEKAIARRQIYSEELSSEESPIFQGPAYVDQDKALSHSLGKGDVMLLVSAIGSMRSDEGSTIRCICFLKRWFKSRNIDSVEYDILYMVRAKGSVRKDFPICVEPWCIKNFQPTDDCLLPSECG